MTTNFHGLQSRTLTKSNLGATMFQAVINKTVQEINNRRLGAFTTLPRKPGSGDAHYVNRRSPGDAKFVDESDAPVYDVSGALTMADGSYTQASFPYKTVLTYGSVTRIAQARGRSYADLLATEIRGKAGDFAETMENFIFQASTAANAKAFDGLIRLISLVPSQLVNVAGASVAGDLLVTHLDKAVSITKGSSLRRNCIWYMNPTVARIVNSLGQAQQVFNDKTVVGMGFEVPAYANVPIVETDGIPNTMAWVGSTLTLSAISGATSNASSAIVLVNTEYVWLDELTPFTTELLAKDTTQFERFEMYWDGAPVLANQLGAAMIVGIDVAGF